MNAELPSISRKPIGTQYQRQDPNCYIVAPVKRTTNAGRRAPTKVVAKLSALLRSRRAGVRAAYRTASGIALIGRAEDALRTPALGCLKGRVNLVFTSPPFPLNRKKKYDNLKGDEYVDWLQRFAEPLASLLTPDGSIVIEVGNAWEEGRPTMSTLAMESLLAFKKAGKLFLCQEFIWHNPARLPTPAQWVTVDRIRVKDAFTRLWWLSPTPRPYADNRQVLVPYSKSMLGLIRRGKYNGGKRPSGHVVGDRSFLVDNGGAIPANVLSEDRLPENVIVNGNTYNDSHYAAYCREHGLEQHPARMPPRLAEFFIKMCTRPGDVVLDPFSGSNVTGAVAQALNRDWVSIEVKPDYAESGRSRFQPATTGPAHGQANLIWD